MTPLVDVSEGRGGLVLEFDASELNGMKNEATSVSKTPSDMREILRIGSSFVRDKLHGF